MKTRATETVKAKMTKNDIKNLALDIKAWARQYKLGNDYCLFYNGIKETKKFKEVDGEWKYVKVKEPADPLKYCEYYSTDSILCMAVDGLMYDVMNEYCCGRAYEVLTEIADAYGCYIESCDSCHFEFVNDIDDRVIEYSKLHMEQIVRLVRPDYGYVEHTSIKVVVPAELQEIMEFWYKESERVGDIGCCTVGEYAEFVWKGTKYRMSAQSPWQGDQSWTQSWPKVKAKLIEIGAENIYLNYGRMD